jgi:hypothetical protein
MAVKRPVRVGVLYIRRIPRDVKDQFKAHCVRRGWSMSWKIEQLMREVLKKEVVEE